MMENHKYVIEKQGTDMQNDLLKMIIEELEIILRTNCFDGSVIYGSIATGDNTSASDLDLFFFGEKEQLPLQEFNILKTNIIDLHHRYQLQLDQEVPYENKLYFNQRELMDSAFSRGLPRTKTGEILIPNITPTQLGDKTTKLRLGFNVLTTPHIGVFKDTATQEFFNKIVKEGHLSLIALGKSLKKEGFSEYDALVKSQDKEGRHHLGYKTSKCLVNDYLLKILSGADDYDFSRIKERQDTIGWEI